MEHAPHNAMTDAAEIERFRDRASDLMGALLDELARSPGVARTFPEVEAALGWPRRRIASVLGGVSHMRHTEFGGHRPYRFLDGRASASRRGEIWMDERQAAALHAADADAARPAHRPAGGKFATGGVPAPGLRTYRLISAAVSELE